MRLELLNTCRDGSHVVRAFATQANWPDNPVRIHKKKNGGITGYCGMRTSEPVQVNPAVQTTIAVRRKYTDEEDQTSRSYTNVSLLGFLFMWRMKHTDMMRV